jgi:hypothetical protein
MTPLQNPGIQSGLKMLEQAPFIGVVIGIPILIIVFLIKRKK